MKLNSLKGKNILVTGASGGIGSAISLKISQLGGNPIMHYNSNRNIVKTLLDEINKEGLLADIIQFDINNELELKSAIDELKKKYSKIDGLVNNAGILTRGFIAMQSVEKFRHIVNTNLVGSFAVMKYISQIMIRQKSGNIVNVSSLAGTMGLKGQSAYSASKAGLNSLTQIAAKELATFNVRVNGVSPGYISSGMLKEPTEQDKQNKEAILLKRFGSSNEVASVVAFLLSENSSYITGQSIIIDGGLSISV
ncbi:SDR family NAD(P)-dependent oxidoreductase [Maribacter sp. M208]|uniref:SDR family NAD(P)-dependent oxidoreductase n=1 Tax=Maribacter huludaoensis TaxID=3030010 RepID=UPI0023EB6AB1|nr:SDR family NAD(P)-dependent oxidoreductase [Maribacter huludaoensis]MDF4221060.1 SDR family NAD(P)-dependent oxidoreductase [Maribacter huludaoensis]